MKKQMMAKATNARSELVKGCLDRMKQIEGRLDYGASPSWLRELDAVHDMLGVAQQLLPLQKLASLDGMEGSEPVRWLREAIGPPPGAGATDDPAELSRRVLRLLDDVDRAVPAARDPIDMLGEVVLKHFEGHGTFMGTIVEYDAGTGFRVQYDDGDTEDVSLRDLRALMPNTGGGGEAGGGEGGAHEKAPNTTSRKKQPQAPQENTPASASKSGKGPKPASRQASDVGGKGHF